MTLALQRRMLPQHVWNQESYGRHVLTHLKPGLHWLDLGCGTRLLASGLEKLESELSHFPFVGLDSSFKSLRAQRHTSLRVQGEGNYLPFRDESFDLITANMVVEHLSDPNLAFREMNRVLAPSGTIVLHTPNLANYLVFGNRVASRLMPRRLHAAFVGISDDRKEEEIYPTFYRANTRGRLRKVVGDSLNVTVQFLPAPRPFFHYFAPLALIELLMTKLSQMEPLQQFGTTLLVTIRKAGIWEELSEVAVSRTTKPAHESAA